MDYCRPVMDRVISGVLVVVLALPLMYAGADTGGPSQATGFKIGEVTDTEAIVWTRLTRVVERVGFDAPMPVIWYSDPRTGALVERKGRPDWPPVVRYPAGYSVDNIEGAVPGMRGEVRVLYRTGGSSEWRSTDWAEVNRQRDFTRQFKLAGLEPVQYNRITPRRMKS